MSCQNIIYCLVVYVRKYRIKYNFQLKIVFTTEHFELIGTYKIVFQHNTKLLNQLLVRKLAYVI